MDAGAINRAVLKQLASHHRNLGLKYRVKGLPYERCAELSWIIEHLQPRFPEHLRYLDIGTGESPLPTFLSMNSRWEINCLDKCPWVRKQHHFSKMLERRGTAARPIRVVETDLLQTRIPDQSFDVITCISTIEHFGGASDSAAMKTAARLLKNGGTLVLTTLVNEPFFNEFHVKRAVYGADFQGSPVFYQRHYDLKSISERLIQPSGLLETQRVYFGDYDFQCFEKVLQRPKPLRVFYSWSTPWLAQYFVSYRSYPVSRKDMRMNTASGVIVVLEKPSP